MRSCVTPARQEFGQHGKRRPAAATGGDAADFLSLPTFTKTIPVVVEAIENDGKWLKVAMLCAELVENHEVKIDGKSSARNIIDQCLSAWASKHCADVQVLDGFHAIAAIDREEFNADFYGDDGKDGASSWYFAIGSTESARYINVKDKLLALEAAIPMLGRTAIHYAEVASYNTMTAFTPEVALYHASHLYWCGMDSDEGVKEEMGYAEMEVEEGMLMPSTFKSAFPELFFTGETLPREDLQRIASENNEAGQTAQVILSIMDLVDQKARLPDMSDHSYETAAFSCYLGMGGDNDTLVRVLDDFFQQANECGDGYTDVYGIAKVPLNRKSFRKWRDEMEKGFALYTSLDRLVRLIGNVVN